MPRKGNGVEIRDTSIRIAFTDHTSTARRETLKTGNVPLLPTPANVKYANRGTTNASSGTLGGSPR